MVVLRSFALFLFGYALVAMEATISHKYSKGRELKMSEECSMLSMLPTTRNEGEEYSMKRLLLHS